MPGAGASALGRRHGPRGAARRRGLSVLPGPGGRGFQEEGTQRDSQGDSRPRPGKALEGSGGARGGDVRGCGGGAGGSRPAPARPAPGTEGLGRAWPNARTSPFYWVFLVGWYLVFNPFWRAASLSALAHRRVGASKASLWLPEGETFKLPTRPARLRPLLLPGQFGAARFAAPGLVCAMGFILSP